MKIDYVSDVVCPWCAIGLKSLEQALERLGDEVEVTLNFQPFQLNPDMPPEGEDLAEHLARKYGRTPEEAQRSQEVLRQRGQAVGFDFRIERRTRTWNTFDAHRLLLWAGQDGQPPGAQKALKMALLTAYFTEGENPSAHEVLVAAAETAGLDPAGARAVLEGDACAAEVRERLQHYRRLGIHAVPSVIVNDRHLIQGGQPPEVFEQALRRIAAQG